MGGTTNYKLKNNSTPKEKVPVFRCDRVLLVLLDRNGS